MVEAVFAKNRGSERKVKVEGDLVGSGSGEEACGDDGRGDEEEKGRQLD